MPRVIISGGGTGGHIFPAIAIANAIKKIDESSEILFVGAKNKMEMEKVPKAGYPIEGLWISGLQRRISLENLLFPIKLLSSMWKANKIIRSFKPQVAVGVGGYASGPLLRVASSRGIPCLIQEQNSFPGITNRWLAKKVNKICVAYNGLEKYFPQEKIILTGNPVREELVITKNKKGQAITHFELSSAKKTLLVTGGSLGARTINESTLRALPTIAKHNWQIIWQTGNFYHDEYKLKEELKSFDNIQIRPFIDKMDLAYAAADLVISRAGAISISEMCLVKKPLILIPSPNVSEDHQSKNANALVTKNAAIAIKDQSAREDLKNTLEEIFTHPELLDNLSRNIARLGVENSANRIAKEVLALIA